MLRLLTRSRAAGAALAATGLVGAGFLATTRVEAEGAAGTRRESVVIIGGGAAGLSVASQLVRKLGSKPVDIVIVEPSDFHYYQPGWTLVGGGVMSPEATRKPMADVAPAGAQLIKSAVSALDPDHNALTLSDGRTLSYDYLVVAAGLKTDFSSVKGLAEAIGHDGVSSIYDYEHAKATWRDISAFKGGDALFTQPSCGIKCGGAPQKIMYLAEDLWRRNGVRANTAVQFLTGLSSMFAVPRYRESLDALVAERGIDAHMQHELVAVDGEARTATFQQPDGSTVVRRYDLLHVTPKMGPPAFVSQSALADKATGYVAVDKHSMQHVAYPNVFACGDVSSTPNSKTAAAVTAQVPVVVHNLLQQMAGAQPGKASYDGYASCPIVTKRGGLILAEFKYGGEIAETFNWIPFFDQAKQSAVMYYMKTLVFPWAYWNLMLQGRWYGTRTIFEPNFNNGK